VRCNKIVDEKLICGKKGVKETRAFKQMSEDVLFIDVADRVLIKEGNDPKVIEEQVKIWKAINQHLTEEKNDSIADYVADERIEGVASLFDTMRRRKELLAGNWRMMDYLGENVDQKGVKFTMTPRGGEVLLKPALRIAEDVHCNRIRIDDDKVKVVLKCYFRGSINHDKTNTLVEWAFNFFDHGNVISHPRFGGFLIREGVDIKDKKNINDLLDDVSMDHEELRRNAERSVLQKGKRVSLETTTVKIVALENEAQTSHTAPVYRVVVDGLSGQFQMPSTMLLPKLERRDVRVRKTGEVGTVQQLKVLQEGAYYEVSTYGGPNWYHTKSLSPVMSQSTEAFRIRIEGSTRRYIRPRCEVVSPTRSESGEPGYTMACSDGNVQFSADNLEAVLEPDSEAIVDVNKVTFIRRDGEEFTVKSGETEFKVLAKNVVPESSVE
jgi:hypothetical protein